MMLSAPAATAGIRLQAPFGNWHGRLERHPSSPFVLTLLVLSSLVLTPLVLKPLVLDPLVLDPLLLILRLMTMTLNWTIGAEPAGTETIGVDAPDDDEELTCLPKWMSWKGVGEMTVGVGGTGPLLFAGRMRHGMSGAFGSR